MNDNMEKFILSRMGFLCDFKYMYSHVSLFKMVKMKQAPALYMMMQQEARPHKWHEIILLLNIWMYMLNACINKTTHIFTKYMHF